MHFPAKFFMKGRQDSALLVLDRSPVWLVEKARKARGFVCKQILIHLICASCCQVLGSGITVGRASNKKQKKFINTSDKIWSAFVRYANVGKKLIRNICFNQLIFQHKLIMIIFFCAFDASLSSSIIVVRSTKCFSSTRFRAFDKVWHEVLLKFFFWRAGVPQGSDQYWRPQFSSHLYLNGSLWGLKSE